MPAGVRFGAIAPVFESINVSSWGTLQEQLPKVRDDVLVVLVQETKLLGAQIPDATHWLAVRGWNAVWLPAQLTEKGGASAGVAILARDRMGIRLPTEKEGGNEVVPHRVLFRTCEAKGGAEPQAVEGAGTGGLPPTDRVIVISIIIIIIIVIAICITILAQVAAPVMDSGASVLRSAPSSGCGVTPRRPAGRDRVHDDAEWWDIVVPLDIRGAVGLVLHRQPEHATPQEGQGLPELGSRSEPRPCLCIAVREGVLLCQLHRHGSRLGAGLRDMARDVVRICACSLRYNVRAFCPWAPLPPRDPPERRRGECSGPHAYPRRGRGSIPCPVPPGLALVASERVTAAGWIAVDPETAAGPRTRLRREAGATPRDHERTLSKFSDRSRA